MCFGPGIRPAPVELLRLESTDRNDRVIASIGERMLPFRRLFTEDASEHPFFGPRSGPTRIAVEETHGGLVKKGATPAGRTWVSIVAIHVSSLRDNRGRTRLRPFRHRPLNCARRGRRPRIGSAEIRKGPGQRISLEYLWDQENMKAVLRFLLFTSLTAFFFVGSGCATPRNSAPKTHAGDEPWNSLGGSLYHSFWIDDRGNPRSR